MTQKKMSPKMNTGTPTRIWINFFLGYSKKEGGQNDTFCSLFLLFCLGNTNRKNLFLLPDTLKESVSCPCSGCSIFLHRNENLAASLPYMALHSFRCKWLSQGKCQRLHRIGNPNAFTKLSFSVQNRKKHSSGDSDCKISCCSETVRTRRNTRSRIGRMVSTSTPNGFEPMPQSTAFLQ